MFILLLLCQSALAIDVSDVPDPRPASHVADLADVLDPAAEARIDTVLAEIRSSSGVETAVVTVPSTSGSPKAFAVALGNRFGLGEAGIDNGLILLLAMKERRLEIEQGSGMEEVLPAAWLQQMQQREMVPLFKQGKFGAGLEEGVRAVQVRLRTGPGESALPPTEPARSRPSQAAPAPTPAAPKETGLFSTWSAALAGAVALLGSLLGAFVFLVRRRPKCPSCKIKMRTLDEVEEDAYLDEGQQLEESIQSRNYYVYICDQCQHSIVRPVSIWFSGYSTCSACSYKTLSSSSVTVVHATYTHGGEVEVTESCQHCTHEYSYTRYTSQLTPPDEDDDDDWGSSGSSSFGSSSSFDSSSDGGSFGGGGSGSSW